MYLSFLSQINSKETGVSDEHTVEVFRLASRFEWTTLKFVKSSVTLCMGRKFEIQIKGPL